MAIKKFSWEPTGTGSISTRCRGRHYRIDCRGRNIGRRDCTGPRSNTQPTPSGRFAGCFRLSHLFPIPKSAPSTLWNVPILGGSKRRLTEIDGDSECAAFSPDGNSAAYAQQEDIYVVRSDGTEAHKLVSAGNDVCHIVWSPDGGAIRFTMKDRIWEVSSNGSGLHEIIPGWHDSSANCCGRWTPDGKFFLFLSEGQIWALDERRGLLRKPPNEPIQLTQGPIHWGDRRAKYTAWAFWGEPIPSKDGSKIFALGFSPRGELSRFDPKTKQFQPFLGGISAQGVVFSKDGKSIAYVSYPEGTLWKADRDGSNPVQLTDAPIEAILPRWSPDGKLISFAADYAGPNGGFYVVSADGGSPRKILPEDRHMDGLLTWSPDGHRMVGTSTSPDGKRVLRILNLDTRQATTIPGSDGLFSPRWSPDGRYVAAASWDGGHLKIFDFKTQQWSELPQEGIPDSPEWSADGQYIYFRRVVGDSGLFRIRIHGGTAEKIADLKDFHDAGWLGRYMGSGSDRRAALAPRHRKRRHLCAQPRREMILRRSIPRSINQSPLASHASAAQTRAVSPRKSAPGRNETPMVTLSGLPTAGKIPHKQTAF